MPEIHFSIGMYGVLALRIDPTMVQGDGAPERPVLRLPLEIQVQPTPDTAYTLLRLTGALKLRGAETLADFDAGPLAEDSDPRPYYRPVNIQVALDLPRVRKFEDARAGADAFLPLSFCLQVCLSKEATFRTMPSQSDLALVVPRSTWVDQVLPKWGLSSAKLIEIRFPANHAGENFRAAYTRGEAAEKHFANGNYKEVLADLWSAFENLAKSQGIEKPNQQYFAQVFADFHAKKKESAKLALDYLCAFFHLGRHQPNESPETFQISRADARFALTMAHTVFEYITSGR